jgi:hypothetical protein
MIKIYLKVSRGNKVLQVGTLVLDMVEDSIQIPGTPKAQFIITFHQSGSN